MAVFDQRNDRLLGLLLEGMDSDPGDGNRFVAMTQAVHDRDQRAVGERLDEVQIAANDLAWDRLRGHTPFDERTVLECGRAHSTHPFAHAYPRALADLRLDGELIHQPFGPRQPDAHAFVAGKAVLHRLPDVSHSRPLVAGNNLDAEPATVEDARKHNFTLFAAVDNVARDFRNGRRNHGRAAAVESQLDRQSPPLLPGNDDVRRRLDRYRIFLGERAHLRPLPRLFTLS